MNCCNRSGRANGRTWWRNCKNLLVILCFGAIFDAPPGYGQGTVVMNNRVTGTLLTRVYQGGECLVSGNGPNDFPVGNMNWAGYAGLEGSGFTAALLSAPGADVPEQALVFQSQSVTTFRTGTGAGRLAATTATLDNVQKDASVATLQMVAWDNKGWTITDWPTAKAAWLAGEIKAGKSPPFNVSNIGGDFNSPAYLNGLQSFNIAFGNRTGPCIFAQPQSQAVTVGSNATFSVVAVNTGPFNYQWRKDGNPIPWATNSDYTLTSVALVDAGNYDVVIQNGGDQATSNPATLQVIPFGAPSISINDQFAVGIVRSRQPATLKLSGGFANGFSFYTLDVTAPTTASALYSGPVTLMESCTVKAMSLSADFSQTSIAPPVEVIITPVYLLQNSVTGSGRIGLNPAETAYLSNAVVAVTAYPDSHWAFDHWEGDLTGTSNPTAIRMDQPHTIVAAFTQTEFPLTISTPGGGAVLVNGQTVAPETYHLVSSMVSISAVPGNGWAFVRWRGSVASTQNPVNLTMDQNQNVQAVFGTVVGINVGGAGTVSMSQTNPVEYGTALTLTAIPASGYHFVAWGGAAAGTTNPTTLFVNQPMPVVSVLFAGAEQNPPVITQQPLPQTALVGTPAEFRVLTGGTAPITYQWRRGGNVISGATRSSYAVASATGDDAGVYDVIVSNPYGSVTSDPATLTVVFPPAIVTAPAPQVVAEGGTAVLSVTAIGTEPLSYQWRNGMQTIPGATQSTYTISPAQTNHEGAYSVVVSNPYGSATSAEVQVKVYIPVLITTHPVDQVVPARGTATFAISANGYPAPTYQWLFNGSAIPSATANSLVLTNIGTNVLGSYSALVSNPYSSATSAVAWLLMAPSIRSPFAGATAVWGRTAMLSVSAMGSGDLRFQWFKDGVAVDGGTNTTLVLPTVQLSDAGMYWVVVSSPYGTATNAPAQLVVNPANIYLGLYAGITIDGVVGYTYGIQYTTDMTDTNSWTTLTNLTLTTPVEIWVDESVNVHSADYAKRFYRVIAHD